MKRLAVFLAAMAAISLSALPVLAAIPVPGAANTNIVLFNPNAQEANLRLTFLNADQTGVAWVTDGGGPIAANGTRTIPNTGFGGQAAGDWAGCADIAADKPLLALALQFWDDEATDIRWAAAYPAQQDGATTAFFPHLTKKDNRQTRVTLQNCEETATTAYVHFCARNGVQSGVKTVTIPALSETTLYLDQVPEADFSATSNIGTGWITATGRIAATASIFYADRADAYAAAAGGETTLYLPGKQRIKNADATYDYSAAVIQNLGTSTANVHAQFVKRDGTVTYEFDDTIAAKGAATYNTAYQGTLSSSTYNALIAALGDNWQGTVKVNSTNSQNLAAVCFFKKPSMGVSDEGIFSAMPASRATSSALIFPLVYRQIQDSNDYIFSTAFVHNTTTSAGTLTVEFYNADGTRRGSSYTVSIAARGLARLDLNTGTDLPAQALTDLGTSFTGSMVVRPSSGRSIVGTAVLYWNEDEIISNNERVAAYAGFAKP